MHFVNAKSILSAQNGMNIYRGCTHGCIYCDAQSDCYQMDHAFTDVEVKQNAPELLRAALIKKRKKCMIGTGAMSDPYMHCEEKLLLTRKCVEIIDELGFGLAIQTKSDRILRDAEILTSINDKAKCVVQTTLTTFDDNLTKLIEPNVCSTNDRYLMLATVYSNLQGFGGVMHCNTAQIHPRSTSISLIENVLASRQLRITSYALTEQSPQSPDGDSSPY